MPRDAREVNVEELARREPSRAQGGGELDGAQVSYSRHAGILARRNSTSQCSVRTKVRPRSRSLAFGRSNMKSRSATAISL